MTLTRLDPATMSPLGRQATDQMDSAGKRTV